MTNSPAARAEATRLIALQHARTLLAAEGLGGLTYSALAQASGVSRQSLYHHWPRIADLINDLPLERVTTPGPATAATARAHLVGLLNAVRIAMDDPERAAVFAHLVAQAEHDPVAERTLQDTAQHRIDAVNAALNADGFVLTGAELALLVGPVLFLRFFLRGTVSAEVVEEIVDSFLAG